MKDSLAMSFGFLEVESSAIKKLLTRYEKSATTMSTEHYPMAVS